ncbi:MAG: 3-dehydroquinate synthase [bacterium]
MKKIAIDLGDRSYPIYIGSDTLVKLKSIINKTDKVSKCLIITNTRIAGLYPLYLNRIQSLFKPAAKVLKLPDGEKYKCSKTLEGIYTYMLKNRFDRNSMIIAMGGGVVGDIAGFAAATYMRGIPYIQIPTTLLAMVDSSIGGKVAVNHALGKNMIGAFYQPRGVLIDVNFLKTLPWEEFTCGMGEVVKYGIIKDSLLFRYIEKNINKIKNLQPDSLIHLITQSCRIKAWVVENDERESGLRAILNYGHTFGHAIEGVTKYRRYKHGQAVMMGMKIAAFMAQKTGMLDTNSQKRHDSLLVKIGMPELPRINPRLILEFMTRDKKAISGSIKLILPKKIGRVTIKSFDSPQLILNILKHLFTFL